MLNQETEKIVQDFRENEHGGILPIVPGPEPLRCRIRPGNPACGMAAHGFICHFSDGDCLRYTGRGNIAKERNVKTWIAQNC